MDAIATSMATPTITPQQLAPVLGSLVTALQSLAQTLQALVVPQGAPAAVAGAAGGTAALGGGPGGGAASGCCCGSHDAVAGATGAGAAPPINSSIAMGAPTQAALSSAPSKGSGAPDKSGKDAKDAKASKSQKKNAPAQKDAAPAKGSKGATSTRDAQGPTTDLPRKNPRSFAQMKSWIEDQVKNPSMSYYRLCLGLTARAYGWKASGTASASEAWKTMPAAQKHAGDRNPPPGSLVFYDTGQSAGHVAIYMGNGKVASNDILRSGKVDIVDMKTIESKWGAKYLGWTPPYFPNA